LTFSTASITGVTDVNATIFYQDGNALIDASGFTMTGTIDMDSNIISNIGAAGTDFNATGSLAIAEDVDITGKILNAEWAGDSIIQTYLGGITLPLANVTDAINSVTGLTSANISSGWTLPATNITAGTFADGNYFITNNLTISENILNATWAGDSIMQAYIGGITLPVANVTGALANAGVSTVIANITGAYENVGRTNVVANITGAFANVGVSGLPAANITEADPIYAQGVTGIPAANITEADPIFADGVTIPIANATGGVDSTGITTVAANLTAGTTTGNFVFTNNLSVNEHVNITAATKCLYLPSGGRLCGNSSCSSLYSPDGTTIMEACN
jgi:hypothetical protein